MSAAHNPSRSAGVGTAHPADLPSPVGPRRRPALAAACVSLLAILALALTAAPALALSAHVFSTSFGSSGSGSGQFSGPSAVAVDQTSHDVYVTDPGNFRVEKFDSAGNFILMFGKGVDQTTGGDVCTAVSVHICQAGTPGSSPGAFTTPKYSTNFIAVDNSGDVYVADTGDSLVSKFDSSGNLITTWGDSNLNGPAPQGQLDGSAATGGPFTAIYGIATDTSGNLFVYDAIHLNWFEFAPNGTPDPTVTADVGAAMVGIGVDSAGNFYKVTGSGVTKYDSSGNQIGDLQADHNSYDTGLALDPATNDLYVDDNGGQIVRYAPSCDPSAAPCAILDAFGSGHLTGASGLAVDSSNGNVYAADTGDQRVAVFNAVTLPDVTTGQASNLAPTSATLNGTVNPSNAGTITDCHFDWGTDSNYTGGSVNCDSNPPDGNSGVPVTANLPGLSPNTDYHFRLVAADANGIENTGADQTFTTPPAVTDLATGQATDLAPTSATLNATFTGVAAPTRCYFDYGTDTSYGSTSSTPPGTDAGSGSGPNQHFAEAVTGLTPETTYRFRVVCTNSFGTTKDSSNQTFTPHAVAGLSTDPATNITGSAATLNGTLNPNGEAITDCHFDYGTGASYGHSAPCSPAPSGSGAVAVHADLTGLAGGTTYFFRLIATNADGTTAGALTSLTTPGSPVPSTCPNAAARSGASANLPDCRAYEMVTPLDKSATNDMFGREASTVTAGQTTNDGNKVLLETFAAFGENPGPGFNTYVFTRTATGWAMASARPADAGRNNYTLRIVSPDLSHLGVNADPYSFPNQGPNQTFRSGPFGGPYTTNLVESTTGDSLTGFAGASSDFSHVVLGANDHSLLPAAAAQVSGSLALYEFVNGTPRLVNVTTGGSLTSPCGALLGEGPTRGYSHNAVSSDGSKIFFVSPDPSARFYGGATDPSCEQPPHLYMRLNGTTTVDVSAPNPGVNDPNGFQEVGYVGASADGSKVFFITATELTADDTTHGVELYEYDTNTATLTRVSRGDSGTAEGGVAWAQVSEDGSAVYFAAAGNLAPGATAGGVYRYDTTTGTTTYITSGADRSTYFGTNLFGNHGDSSESIGNDVWSEEYTTPNGRFLAFSSGGELYRYGSADQSLTCVSCPPHGAPAGGAEFASVQNTLALSDVRSLRPISDDGSRVFFDTSEQLVPRDTNNARDVYEWEADGAGTCHSTAQNGGCLYLISSGRDPSDSFFVDSSSNGRDVFFGTHAQLVPADTDSSGDLYEARVGGGFPPPVPPPACEGDACQTPATAPNDPTPASSGFSGPGNPTPKRHKARKHHKKRHHKRAHHLAANRNRRAGK